MTKFPPPVDISSVSVIVPTYREVDNLRPLVERLRVLREAGLDLELLIMDDDSRDGSEQVVRSLALPWVRIVTRHNDRSLSHAVLDGLSRATRDTLVVLE